MRKKWPPVRDACWAVGFAGVKQGVAGVVVSRVQKAPLVAAGVERVSAFLRMVEVARVLQVVLLSWCKQEKSH